MKKVVITITGIWGNAFEQNGTVIFKANSGSTTHYPQIDYPAEYAWLVRQIFTDETLYGEHFDISTYPCDKFFNDAIALEREQFPEGALVANIRLCKVLKNGDYVVNFPGDYEKDFGPIVIARYGKRGEAIRNELMALVKKSPRDVIIDICQKSYGTASQEWRTAAIARIDALLNSLANPPIPMPSVSPGQKYPPGAPCKGINCTDPVVHSAECLAEHAATVAGGLFYLPQTLLNFQ